MCIDIIGVVAFVEQGFYGDFLLVPYFAFVVHSNQFRGFSSEHTAINEYKFPHEILVVLLILPPTMELQKKSIDALLESVAILRHELQNNQDPDKEIELLGELKLLSARVYIECDLGMLGGIESDGIETDGLEFVGTESTGIEPTGTELDENEADGNEADGLEFDETEAEGLESTKTESVGYSGYEFAEETIQDGDSDTLRNEPEEFPVQQDLFFSAVPVLGPQTESISEEDDFAKNANEEDVFANSTKPNETTEELIDASPSVEFSNPSDGEVEFESNNSRSNNLSFESEPHGENMDSMDVSSPVQPISFEVPDFALPEFHLPDAVDANPAIESTNLPEISLESKKDVADRVIDSTTDSMTNSMTVSYSMSVSGSDSVLDSVEDSVPVLVPDSAPVSVPGDLPPPALSGMNVEAIINQMPISRRFEFANLLFGGDIQRMGTFIHELLQAPSGSGRIDVYERWYEENNWRRRDEAASDMLRLIKRIFPS